MKEEEITKELIGKFGGYLCEKCNKFNTENSCLSSIHKQLQNKFPATMAQADMTDQSLCDNKNKYAKSLYCTEWNNASCDSGASYHRYDPYCNADVGYIDMIFTKTLIFLGRRVEFEFKAKILSTKIILMIFVY
jgi:hypothetical protein